MSGDIRAGDVVVCVDAGPDRTKPGFCPVYAIKEGDIYRVTSCFLYLGIYPAVVLAGVVPDTTTGGYDVQRFRKLRAADEQFTATIRACKPIRQKERA